MAATDSGIIGAMTTAFTSIEQEIRYKLAHRRKSKISDPGWIPASVLIALFEKEGRTYIVFTRRTQVVEHHKGQICFPGGGSEDGETKLNTALRESFEEIGLRPEEVEILGELDDTRTVTSNFIITPFVAHIPYPYEFRPSSFEIDAMISLPLDALRNPANWRTEVRELDDGMKGEVYFVKVDGSEVWGATAKILKQLVEILGEPKSEADNR